MTILLTISNIPVTIESGEEQRINSGRGNLAGGRVSDVPCILSTSGGMSAIGGVLWSILSENIQCREHMNFVGKIHRTLDHSGVNIMDHNRTTDAVG